MLKYHYLEKKHEQNLKTYQYSGSDKSYLYNYFLSPIANFCVEYLIPRWMAPNLITLLGFMCVFIPHLILIAYFPETLEGDVPTWLSLILATLHLIYMNFDNIDGKQARKTGNSSPLGLLFDHGCDSMVILLEGISLATCLQIGNSPKSLIVYLIGCLPFFFTTLEEYYTKSLILPMINGPCEGCLIIFIIFFLTGLFGSNWWNELDQIFKLPRKDVCFYFFVIGSLINVLMNFWQLYKKARGKFFEAFQKMLFYIYMIASITLVFTCSPQGVTNRQAKILIYILGINFGKQVVKDFNQTIQIFKKYSCSKQYQLMIQTMLQLAHVSNSEYKSFRKTTFIIISSLNINTVFGIIYGEYLVDEDMLLMILFIASIFVYLHMVINIIYQLSNVLEIKVFRVKSKEKAKQ